MKIPTADARRKQSLEKIERKIWYQISICHFGAEGSWQRRKNQDAEKYNCGEFTYMIQ